MSEQNILATIDGVNITDADLDAYIANLPKEQQAYAAYPQFREHALKQLLAFHLQRWQKKKKWMKPMNLKP